MSDLFNLISEMRQDENKEIEEANTRMIAQIDTVFQDSKISVERKTELLCNVVGYLFTQQEPWNFVNKYQFAKTETHLTLNWKKFILEHETEIKSITDARKSKIELVVKKANDERRETFMKMASELLPL